MPAYSQVQDAKSIEMPRLEDIGQRLTNLNDNQIGLLQQLEEKMHKIHSRRLPEKERNNSDKSMPNDSIQFINVQLDRLSSQNEWLEKLLTHISEII